MNWEVGDLVTCYFWGESIIYRIKSFVGSDEVRIEAVWKSPRLVKEDRGADIGGICIVDRVDLLEPQNEMLVMALAAS